jgi:hypothetical protein
MIGIATRTCLFAFAALLLTIVPAASQERSGSPCLAPPAEALSRVGLPGEPFDLAASRDGCSVYVTYRGRSFGVAFIDRRQTPLRARTIPLGDNLMTPGQPVLTGDEKLLIVALGRGVAFLETDNLRAGAANATSTVMRDRRFGVAGFVTMSADERLLFVSTITTASTVVIDMAKARQSSFSPDAIVGVIPTGVGNGFAMISPDHRRLVIGSTPPPGDARLICEAGDKTAATQRGVSIVDIGQAATNPSSAFVGSFQTGCTIPPFALSFDGRLLFTEMNKHLVAFDVTSPTEGPAAMVDYLDLGGAVRAFIPAGRASTYLVLLREPSWTSANADAIVEVDVSTKPATIRRRVTPPPMTMAGSNVWMKLLSDARTLLVANRLAGTLDIIDIDRLPSAAGRESAVSSTLR